jgi:hypothetical protein
VVLELQLRPRSRRPHLSAALAAALALSGASHLLPSRAAAQEGSGAQLLRDAQALYQSGQYFKAARYAFAANEADASLEAEAHSWVTLGLAKANLHNAASYFFIKTLQSGSRPAIQRALTQTQTLLVEVGSDVFRKYLVKHTQLEDYDSANRSAFLYSLAREALLAGQAEKAVGHVGAMSQSSPLWPFALQLRGSAHAILGRGDAALRDFGDCVEGAGKLESAKGRDPRRQRQRWREAEDLKARCEAGTGRTLYQLERFEEADVAYDRIPKGSLVWPDILFEQAWNSFAKEEYNRTLGKLVSYKSPALSFVFNTEVDVLRAQSFLALCLYDDANEVINEFNSKYTKVGEEVKRFVEGNASSPYPFYELGKDALKASLYAGSDFQRMANRFVRGPYFQGLVASEKDLTAELEAIRRFDQTQPGVSHERGKGFPGFLSQVLGWRLKSIRLLGGAFVKNSLIDHHRALIADFEKMAFIKLEMLRRAKEKLMYRNRSTAERSRGNVVPSRRDYQYYWSFNGEFWNDELGDYVFGLESDCGNT